GRDRDSNGPPIWLIVYVYSIVTYFLSYLLIRTISRYREYAADRGSALITGAPEHLMSALQKIASQISLIPQRDLRQVEGMNAFFIVPTNVKAAAAELFMTHPPLEKRLARLAEIAREMGTPVERRTDDLGFEWLIVRDPDLEDLVTTVHLIDSELAERGFGPQLLASAFRFDGGKHPVYWIYGYKRGAFWPFVPTGEGQKRD